MNLFAEICLTTDVYYFFLCNNINISVRACAANIAVLLIFLAF